MSDDPELNSYESLDPTVPDMPRRKVNSKRGFVHSIRKGADKVRGINQGKFDPKRADARLKKFGDGA